MKNLKRLRERRSKVLVAIMMSMIITQGLYSSDSIIANAQEQTSNHSKSTINHNQKRNVMYYGDWSIWGEQENFYPKDIPADKLTHLNFAFLDFDSNGNLKFTDKDAAVGAPVGQDGVQWGAANAGVLSAFQELKAKNPNLKIGVSLGGWSKSGDFSEVASNPDKRAKLVKNILKFIEYTNMDFVDIDWEYPCDVRQPDLVDNKNDEGTPNATKADKENYIKLLQEFRTELDKQGNELNKGYELSVAIPAPKSKVDLGIDVKNLFNIVDFANIMTMCYGNGTLLPGENYGTASIRAIDNTKNQVQQYFKKYANISLTDSEAYKKVGTTSSIGFEGEAYPIFGTDWAKLVIDHSIEKGLGMTSFWSMNRDAMLETNKGVTSQYQFTDIYKTFGEGAEPGDSQKNQAPTLHGIDNKTIYVGDKFNELEGISAADREDGDLTSKIKVEGKVDTTKAGDYKISYSVADSEGLTTNKQRTITVKEKPDPSQDTYDSNKIYLEGDSVVFKGEKYVAKWWVKGEDPDKSQAWQKKVTPNEDGSIDYYEGLVCQGGELVRYNGHTYKAKWWTNTTPGSDDTWELIK